MSTHLPMESFCLASCGIASMLVAVCAHSDPVCKQDSNCDKHSNALPVESPRNPSSAGIVRRRVIGATPILADATCAAILDGAAILSARFARAPLQNTIQIGPGQFQQGYDDGLLNETHFDAWNQAMVLAFNFTKAVAVQAGVGRGGLHVDAAYLTIRSAAMDTDNVGQLAHADDGDCTADAHVNGRFVSRWAHAESNLCCPWRTLSTLLYLNSGITNDDRTGFSGGRLVFRDRYEATTTDSGAPGAQDGTVTPACGQIVSFTSDASNVHSVEPVSGAGRRFAIAMWFTDVERQREPSDSSLPQRASTGTREHASATNRAPQSLLLTKQRTQSDG
eukprot:m.752531 g.752531  ORF g.752531 m.752531 type:complete len:335 (-) comp23169_c0_seq29:117-1121(-)